MPIIQQRTHVPFGSESKDLFGTSPSPRHYLLEQGTQGGLCSGGNAGSSIITLSSSAAGAKGKKQQSSTYGSLDMLNHENL